MTKTEQAHKAGQHETNPNRRCKLCWALAEETQRKIRGEKPSLGGMISMTYGTMPSIVKFANAFARECPKGTYAIGNDREGRDGIYDEDELWQLVVEHVELWQDGDEEAGDFASAVLSTLGFEWI